jgi:hypothetical protein
VRATLHYANAPALIAEVPIILGAK